MSTKVTTLSLSGNTGTVSRNRDNSREESVIHLTGPDGVTGQLALRIPVARNEAGEEVEADKQGLTPGDYSVNISMTRAAQQPDAGNVSSADVGTGASGSGARVSRRASDVSGG